MKKKLSTCEQLTVDELGRVYLPSFVRNHMGINVGDYLRVFTNEECMYFSTAEDPERPKRCKVDQNWRIVIPKIIRRYFNLEIGDKLNLEVIDKEMFYLIPAKKECIFCNETENLVTFKGSSICRNCSEALFEQSKAI